jgi:3-hydroxyisobutyrate dehydrogenase-like beta-hydroxyacid dehydrogenase
MGIHMSSEKVAFIGLGVMGFPMAGHLVRAGFDVTVFNRTSSRAEAWAKEYSGKVASTPAGAAMGCSVVFCCVGSDDDLRSVTLGDEGALDGMSSGSVFVDHTTTSAQVARELAAHCEQSGLEFVDAPVSGGQAGAENGQLTVMMGGSEEAVQKVSSIIDCYAKMKARLGEAGSGQLAKMVNQICLAGTIQGLAEAIHFARQSGLQPEAVIEVISRGAAQSWQMDNRAKTMIADEYEFGFAVDWMRKDLGYVLAEARRIGARLPVAALVDQFYAEVQAMGGGRWDTSSLLRPLESFKKPDE